jgi:DNA-binding NarL/FixJ family response regulator
VLVADDQEEMRRTVERLLKSECNVVGTVENGQRVLEVSQSLAPDILVVDISMPVMNGIEAAARLKQSGSSAKVIFLTVLEDPDFVAAALSAGAVGYVLKPALATDLLLAIHEALQGHIFISSPMHAY